MGHYDEIMDGIEEKEAGQSPKTIVTIETNTPRAGESSEQKAARRNRAPARRNRFEPNPRVAQMAERVEPPLMAIDAKVDQAPPTGRGPLEWGSSPRLREAAGNKRVFDTGATRDLDDSKLDFEGFLSPLVLERFAEYMSKNRQMADGSLRDSDNWQKGIPLAVYMKSAWRHFFAWWKGHRAGSVGEEELCALLFNVNGYLHETLSRKPRG